MKKIFYFNIQTKSNLKKYLKYAPFYLLSILPFWFIYGFASFAFFILYHLAGYRKEVINQNLKNSFPEKSEQEIKKISKNFYHHFCETFLEAVKFLTISKKAIVKRYKFKNLDLLEDLYSQKQSAILYAAHFGNWEWMCALPLSSDHKLISFYQEQSNNYFNDFMLLLRERFGNQCVESKSGFKEIIKNSRAGNITLTYVIGDQSPMSKSSMHWINFLNQDTAFLIGADRMAKKCNQLLIYPHVTKPKKGFYEIEFKLIPTEDEDKSAIEHYASFLEGNIKAQPELWLWSHKRWKRKRNA